MGSLDPLRQKLRLHHAAVADRASESTLTQTRAAAPRRTGELRGSGYTRLVSRRPGLIAHEIGFTAKQAAFTDRGTKPHRIVGRPVLVFKVGGRTVFARAVNHPGTKAQGWFTGGRSDGGKVGERWRDNLQDQVGG